MRADGNWHMPASPPTPNKERSRTQMRWVQTRGKPDRHQKKRMKLRRRWRTDLSPWEPWCCVTCDRQPHFTSDPVQTRISAKALLAPATANLLLLVFHQFAPRRHLVHPFLLCLSSLVLRPLPPRISTSFTPSTALTLPLTGRAAVADTYPAENSQAGSMDCNKPRGERAAQPGPRCMFFACISYVFT